jgi:hypothetical protein
MKCERPPNAVAVFVNAPARGLTVCIRQPVRSDDHDDAGDAKPDSATYFTLRAMPMPPRLMLCNSSDDYCPRAGR